MEGDARSKTDIKGKRGRKESEAIRNEGKESKGKEGRRSGKEIDWVEGSVEMVK